MGYPKIGIRKNSLANDYVSIALKAYSEMKEWYETLKVQEADLDSIFDYNLIYQKRIIATVFAHMAIESFINNYAAACLGDNEFYDNFDKLSIEGKLQLISKFILNYRLEKNNQLCASLKRLKRNRNNFIHNKSYKIDAEKSRNYRRFVLGEDYAVDDEIENEYKIFLRGVGADLIEVKKSIKAIIELANFFDSRDENVLATLELFGFFSIPKIIREDLREMGLNYNEI